MSKRKRQKYTSEFKEAAVKLIREEGYQITEAARNLGIHSNMLGRWKRESEKTDEESTGDGSIKSLKAELAQLKKENKRLQMEREILKKAAAFFAKESK